MNYYLDGKPVALKKASTLTYLHQEHLESAFAATDGAGSKTADASYCPYGATRANTGSLGTNKKFTGQRLDGTGLYYMGARYYDPDIARFTTAGAYGADPAAPQTFNRYSYASNNPTSLPSESRPSGAVPWATVHAGGGTSYASAAGNGSAGKLDARRSMSGAEVSAATRVSASSVTQEEEPVYQAAAVAPASATATGNDPMRKASYIPEVDGDPSLTYPPRNPDYYSFDVNVGIKFGSSFQVIIDYLGRVFWSPFGGNVGRTSVGFFKGYASFTITAGWLLQPEPPEADDLKNFLSGLSTNLGGGFVFGANWVFVPTANKTKWAYEIVFFSPQIGVSGHVTWPFPIPALPDPDLPLPPV